MTDSPQSTPTLISTPLQLRALAEAAVAKFGDYMVGVPVTGPIHRSLDLSVDGRRSVKGDVVQPCGKGPHPAMVFIHGGGWVMGDLDTHHQLVLRFAEQGFVVVAMDYGLAPEQPFPAGYEDAVTAVRWTLDNVARFDGDPERLVLVGDSAGANIAAGMAVSERDLPIRALGLAYGVYDLEHMPTAPHVHANDFLSNLHQAYVGAENLHLLKDPRVSPIHAAERLPPAIVMVGSTDPLATEAAALAERLRQADIPHQHVVVADYPHAFLHLETMPETLPAFATIARFLHAHSAPAAD